MSVLLVALALGGLPHHTLATQHWGEHRVHALTNSHPLIEEERTELTYHVETGIPIGYERRVGGQVVESHRTTSLVLASGERIH